MPFVEHPSCQQPADPDSLVWRFMDLTKYLWTLSTGALYFARADRFKDPYEGQLPDEMMAAIKGKAKTHSLRLI